MTIKWGSCVCLVVLLALLMGCRTPQPNLKPPKTPEVLTVPPDEARFATPKYPDQAFDRPDPSKPTSIDDVLKMGNSSNRGMGPGGPGGGGGGMPGR